MKLRIKNITIQLTEDCEKPRLVVQVSNEKYYAPIVVSDETGLHLNLHGFKKTIKHSEPPKPEGPGPHDLWCTRNEDGTWTFQAGSEIEYTEFFLAKSSNISYGQPAWIGASASFNFNSADYDLIGCFGLEEYDSSDMTTVQPGTRYVATR